jgi:hypothetical protein
LRNRFTSATGPVTVKLFAVWFGIIVFCYGETLVCGRGVVQP